MAVNRGTTPLGRFILLVLVVICTFRASGMAASVDRRTAEAIGARWLQMAVDQRGSWAGDLAPAVRRVTPLTCNGMTVGWLCEIAPAGYVVVPSRRELSPIKASSEHGRADAAASGGFSGFVLDDLCDRVARLARAGDPSVPSHPAWDRLLGGGLQDKSVFEEAGPLLTTRWTQGWPYNTACPTGDGGRTFVGCTALAAAQLMRYHAWPVHGRGESAYWWSGDDGCGGGSPGDTLRAAHDDPYDWEAMDEVVDGGSSQRSHDAVAELCYETAVACRMDFSVCGSSASLSRARTALLNRFRYDSAAAERQRFHMSDEAWFDLIRANVDRGLPLLYSSTIHSMVCDGWREVDGLRQVHINFGWGGDSDGWFALDAIETSLNPDAERMICEIAPDLSTPVELDAFTAVRVDAGARLDWRVAASSGVDGLHVWRGDAAGGRDRLTNDPLPVRADMTWTDPAPLTGETAYWLQEVSADAQTWYGPALLAGAAPRSGFDLTEPSPNPCNPLTVVHLIMDRPGRVRASVHDARGRLVRVLEDGPLPAGRHALRWEGTTLTGRPAASGTYVLCVSSGIHMKNRKLILVR